MQMTRKDRFICLCKELRGNVASFLLAQLMHWDMEKEEEMKLSEDDTSEDIAFRNHIYLEMPIRQLFY